LIYLINGNMPLNAAYADEIVQEDNSTYQLTFRFPTSDSLWEKLKEETFLTADDLHGEQDFVIFEVEKKHGYIQVYANQVFTLLNNYVVNPISLDRQTGSTALSRFAGSITRDNPFSFFSDIEDRHTFNIDSKNAMEAFAKDKHSIIGQWGGDLVRHGYQVRLLKNGGSENESLFMYKKNLSSYQHKTSTKSLKTRITFKTTVKGEGEKPVDKHYKVVVDSPLINKYSQIYEDVVEVNDQDVVDEATLLKYGKQYFRTTLCDMLEDSLELEVVGQSDVPVQMFDIVSIFHEHYNLDVRKKITKYTYSPMAKKLKSIGFGQFQSGLANAIGNAVSDAVKGEAQQLQADFERQLARELKNADLAFDRQKEELVNQFTDGLNATKARAEEIKRQISSEIDKKFQSFDNAAINEARRKAEEAIRSAGASTLLAQEAKWIGLDSIAKLDEFKRQATSAQTALSGDLDVLKQTVTSEVNQASEYRRTTTEALSRMTGQMNGFATKSEVKQGIDGLTQTFAKMKVGGRNYYRDSEKVRTSTRFFPFPLHPYLTQENVGEIWTLSFDLKINEGGEIRPLHFYHYQNNRFGMKASADITPSKEWQRFTFTGPVIFPNDDPRYARGEMALYDFAGNNSYSVRRIKLEKGTLATDWSPAIEDADGLITEAKAIFERTAQGLRTDLSAIQEYVNKDGQRQEALQRYTREESARQATAVRELVNRDFVGKSAYQEDVRSLERRFSAISTQTNNDIATKIAQYKQTVDGQFASVTSQIAGKANQVDFQRVRETSQLYERILGNTENGIADKVARMAMTNQLFQVEVGKAFAEHQNLFLNSTLTKGFLGNNGIIYVANATQKEVTSDFISVDPNEKIIFQHWVTLPENGMAWTAWQFFDKNKNPIDNRKPGLNAYKTTVGKQHNINQITVPTNAYFVRFSARMYDDGLIKVEQGSTPSDYSVAPNDALEAVKTVQRQLDGSWSVQNINSAGDIISGVNLGADGRNRFIGKTFHITGETLIDKAVIKSAMVDKLKTANFEAGSVTTTILDAEAVTADKVRMDQAFANKLVASNIFTDTLAAKEAFINKLRSVVVTATFLEGFQGKIGGFRFGQYTNRNGYFITGINSVSIGMGNGMNAGANRNAFWANWGESLDTPGPKAWYVNTDGTMYCRNEASFYSKVDFASTSKVNFYSRVNAEKGLWLASDDVFGEGNNPVGGYNRVVWWSQIVTGKFRQHAGITTGSDRKLKENIEPTPVNALDKINALNLVAFDYIKDKTHEEIGLIAQEVLNIIPGSVEKYEGEDNHLTINYSKFVPYLIKAVQELNQKLEEIA
jgi:phage minor structural protein, N-terminal domain protein